MELRDATRESQRGLRGRSGLEEELAAHVAALAGRTSARGARKPRILGKGATPPSGMSHGSKPLADEVPPPGAAVVTRATHELGNLAIPKVGPACWHMISEE